jgi:hypothetical protein
MPLSDEIVESVVEGEHPRVYVRLVRSLYRVATLYRHTKGTHASSHTRGQPVLEKRRTGGRCEAAGGCARAGGGDQTDAT